MKTIIEKRYESSEHFDYPEMEKLIDRVIENPELEFTIPKKFLVKKHNNINFLGVLIHKIKVFVRSIWLNIKKAFDEDYRNKFKLAVRKIIRAYDEASKVSKTAEEIITPLKIPETTHRQEEKILEQQVIEKTIKQQIEKPEIHQVISSEEKTDKQTEKTKEGIVDAEQQQKVQIQPPVNSLDEPEQLTPQDTKDLPKATLIQPADEQQNANVQKKEKQEEKPVVKTSYQTMCDDIKLKTHNGYLMNLWKALFSNVTDMNAHIKKWSCNSNNKFTIRLKKPLHFWIDTDRVGGCVFSFGNNRSNIIRGSFERNKIVFDSGFTSYCVENLWLAYKRVEPKMNEIHYIKQNKIEMSGTYWGMTKEHSSSYTKMHKEWSKEVTVIPDNYPGGYKDFLEGKFEQQK